MLSVRIQLLPYPALQHDNRLHLKYFLKKVNLKKSLVQVGFKEIEFFSSFKLEPFGGKHLPSVVSCKK